MTEIIEARVVEGRIEIICNGGEHKQTFNEEEFKEYASRNSVSRSPSFVASSVQDYSILNAYAGEIDRIIKRRNNTMNRNRN